MILVPFDSARAFVALGSWLVLKVPNAFTVKGCYEWTCCLQRWERKKEGESSVGALFIVDTTWPQGAADIRWNRITSSLTNFHGGSKLLTPMKQSGTLATTPRGFFSQWVEKSKNCTVYFCKYFSTQEKEKNLYIFWLCTWKESKYSSILQPHINLKKERMNETNKQTKGRWPTEERKATKKEDNKSK